MEMGRRKSPDDVVVRLLHLAEETAGVGGERLHVPPLALPRYRVSNASELFPLPETPVNTTSFFFGISA